MKKLTAVLASVLMVISMSGCEDAKATISNPKEAILTIGSHDVTKNDVYEVLNASIGGQVAITNSIKTVTSKEITDTEELTNQAKEQLESLKSIYGDQFNEVLKQMNVTEEDYMNDFVIPAIKASELNKVYIDEHFDELIKQYDPIQATVLSFTSQEDANAALSGLKDGSITAIEAATKYDATSKGNSEIVTLDSVNYDAVTLSSLRALNEDDGWTSITSDNGSVFYVMKVDSKDPNAFKDEFVAFVSSNPSFPNTVTEYYFKKYGFHVYDITLYNVIKAQQPNLLVQDVKEEAPKATPATTEAPQEEAK